MCESHINDTLRRRFDVKRVSSSRGKAKTEIIAENPIDEDELRNALGEIGYTLWTIKTEPYKRKGLFRR